LTTSGDIFDATEAASTALIMSEQEPTLRPRALAALDSLMGQLGEMTKHDVAAVLACLVELTSGLPEQPEEALAASMARFAEAARECQDVRVWAWVSYRAADALKGGVNDATLILRMLQSTNGLCRWFGVEVVAKALRRSELAVERRQYLEDCLRRLSNDSDEEVRGLVRRALAEPKDSQS